MRQIIAFLINFIINCSMLISQFNWRDKWRVKYYVKVLSFCIQTKMFVFVDVFSLFIQFVTEFQISLNHISSLIRCRLDLSLLRQSQGSLWHNLCVGVRTPLKLFLQVLYLNYNLLYIHQTCMFNASGSTKDLNGSDAESGSLILDAEGD